MHYICSKLLYCILSLLLNVVNYDNDNGWTTLLDKFSDTPVITKEVGDALNALKDINMQNVISAEQFGKRIGYTNEQFFSFAKQADLSGDVLQQYKEYSVSASTATSKFGAATKGRSIKMYCINIIA